MQLNTSWENRQLWHILNSHNHGLLTVSRYAQMKSEHNALTFWLMVCAYLVAQHNGMTSVNIDVSINHMRFLISNIFLLLCQCEWCSKWKTDCENILILILLYMCAFQDIHRFHSLELPVMGYIVCSLPIDAALGVRVIQWTHPLLLVMIWLRTLDKAESSAYKILVLKYYKRECLWDVVVDERMLLRSVLKK